MHRSQWHAAQHKHTWNSCNTPTALHHRCSKRAAGQRRCAGGDAEAGAAEPHISITFVAPDPQQQPVTVQCPSGEQLRACMLENKASRHSGGGGTGVTNVCWCAGGRAHHNCVGRRLSHARAPPRGSAVLRPHAQTQTHATGGSVHCVGQAVVVRRRWPVRHLHRPGARPPPHTCAHARARQPCRLSASSASHANSLSCHAPCAAPHAAGALHLLQQPWRVFKLRAYCAPPLRPCPLRAHHPPRPQVQEGGDLLSERTATENKKLNKASVIECPCHVCVHGGPV